MRGVLLTIGFLAVATATRNPNCTDGLYMIVARGTTEPAAANEEGLYPENSGSHGYLAQLIAAHIKDSSIIGPLTSVVLCRGAGGDFNHNPPLLPDRVKSTVVAAVLFGDPTDIANAAYDRDRSFHNGTLPRTNNIVCKQYGDRMTSWCDQGDDYATQATSMRFMFSIFRNTPVPWFNTWLKDGKIPQRPLLLRRPHPQAPPQAQGQAVCRPARRQRHPQPQSPAVPPLARRLDLLY
ncbi:hypothetical protein PENARI_c002G02428 [Penicillium arizonense]|uniref:Cutinase n=1 Tax=Penicillium arizonense TaxID=1835702 RepID=A0A1F5LWV5_PENAI|nr:hypothetical protein PENARI_c002G02428 [Penicillium arizonense]OGE57421.1 hypothetical protein PENARI_c002G02428 [Penicillium arizonense]